MFLPENVTSSSSSDLSLSLSLFPSLSLADSLSFATIHHIQYRLYTKYIIDSLYILTKVVIPACSRHLVTQTARHSLVFHPQTAGHVLLTIVCLCVCVCVAPHTHTEGHVLLLSVCVCVSVCVAPRVGGSRAATNARFVRCPKFVRLTVKASRRLTVLTTDP